MARKRLQYPSVFRVIQIPSAGGGAPGQVVFDAQTSPVITSNSGNSFSNTTLTIGSGTNRALVAFLALGSAFETPSMTWGGVSLTLLSSIADTGANQKVYAFGLLNPASGTGPLVGSWTNSISFFAAGVSFTGVDQTSLAVAFPHTTTNTGTSTTVSVTVTSATGNIVAAVQGASSQGAVAPSPSDTSIFNGVTTSGYGASANRKAGATSTVLTSTLGSSQPWSTVGVDIQAATVVQTLTFGPKWTDGSFKSIAVGYG